MLPVATPPNAIVYAASDLRIPEMILTGLVMNVISVGVSLLIFNLIGDPILGISQFPQWAVERGGASSHNSSIDMMDTTCKALISRL